MRALVAAARRPRAGLALIAALHLASLGLFIHGFLLTRVHLDQRSVWPGEGGRNAQAAHLGVSHAPTPSPRRQ